MSIKNKENITMFSERCLQKLGGEVIENLKTLPVPIGQSQFPAQIIHMCILSDRLVKQQNWPQAKSRCDFCFMTAPPFHFLVSILDDCSIQHTFSSLFLLLQVYFTFSCTKLRLPSADPITYTIQILLSLIVSFLIICSASSFSILGKL